MGELAAVPGIRIGVSAAGIKYPNRDDIALFELAPGCAVGGVFTQNAFRAPPVAVAAGRLGHARAFVVNSGNANAATGERGEADAKACCAAAAAALGCGADEVLPFSTGVIGEFLPMGRMRDGITRAAAALHAAGWGAAARAMMTTDTQPKGVSATFPVAGRTVTATAIVKGSGMIRPNMATMLAFLGTDAKLSPAATQRLAAALAERSFNRLTVDGDTSTNDAFAVAATGAAGVGDGQEDALLAGLTPLVVELAQRTVRDGEGATKFVTVNVSGGATREDCRRVAYAVAHSPLVKTAIFAGDANWGRFCMAIGNAGVPGLEPGRVSLHLNDVCVAEGGVIAASYTEAAGTAVMAQDEFEVSIDLGAGPCAETVWTSDLSHDYVRINAEYRT